MNKPNQKNRGAFSLEGNYLYVANDGNGFDRDGVNALCRPNLSAKGDIIIDNVVNTKDKDWLEALKDFQLETYERDPNRLQTDKKEEDSTIQQYNGRWLFELLQNIDDAIGPKDIEKYIGTKGLGFLSTMEVANYPSIFSDVFNFTFSREKTKEALSKKGFTSEQVELAPNFQVPWPTEDDKTIRLLKKEGFTTVIRFKIREDHLEDVKEQLLNLDYHFLLFSQHIQNLSLEINGEKKYFSREIKRISGNEDKNKSQISINIDQPENKRKKEEWIRWLRSWKSTDTKKRSSTMFCLPFEKGKCKAYPENTKIYNFYPTDEPSDIKGLLHISFNLTRDRKRLEMWGDQKVWGSENCDSENLKLIDQINGLIGEDVVDDRLASPGTIIECFSALNNFHNIKDTKGRPGKQIKKTLINTIKQESFIPRFGGGNTNLNNLTLWKYDLLDCIVENKKIQDVNLPSKNTEHFFKQLEPYECRELDLEKLINLLVSYEIKNQSSEGRENITRLIEKYAESHTYYSNNIECEMYYKRIAFLENNKGAVVSLNDGYFSVKKFQIPSFIKVSQLSSSTIKTLNKLLLNNKKIDKQVQNWTLDGLIQDKNDLISKVLKKSISNRDEAFWENYGFETLSFLFQAYVEDPDIIYRNNLRVVDFFIPEIKSGKWKPASSGFFSRSWEKTSHLSDWFAENADQGHFEITSKNVLRKEILSKKQIEDKNKREWIKRLYDFLSLLNVNRYPTATNFTDYYYYFLERIETLDDEYVRGLKNDGLIECRFDLCIKGLDKFLKRESKAEVLFLLNQMASKYKEKNARYFVHRGRRPYRPTKYENFAIFQLYTTKCLKLAKSPIRFSGFFSLKEVYISDKPDKIFPRISKKEAVFLKYFNSYGLSKRFDPPIAVWEKWVNHLPKAYKTLLAENHESKRLNAQVVLLFEKYFERNYNLLYFSHLPILPSDKVLEFFETCNVLWNDTDIDDDHLSLNLKDFGYGLFCLNKLNRIEKSDLNNSGLRKVSEIFKIETNEKRVDDDTQTYFLNWLEERWDIFSALNTELGDKNETRLFSEIENRLFVCENIEISVVPFEDKRNFEPKHIYIPFRHIRSNETNDEQGLLFVEYDDQKLKLLQFLCAEYFQWERSFSIIKDLFDPKNTDEEIKNVLKGNSLNPNLIEHFSALEKDEVYLEREQQLQEFSEKGNLVKAVSGLPSPAQTQTDTQANNARPANKNISIKSKNQTSDTVPKSQKSKKVTESNNSVRKAFGSRLSGHLRVRHGNEVTVRPYFDDEDDANPENKRIGELAEEYVFELLRAESSLENVILYGGTNKGFDIDYQKDNERYFVEVKGLSNDWRDSDILLSKSQFEKAQEEGERYSIFIVEFVDDDDKRRVSELKNPASFFTKMQIDHGWRNFVKEFQSSKKF